MKDWLTGGSLVAAMTLLTSAAAQAAGGPSAGAQLSGPQIVLPALPPAPAVVKAPPALGFGFQPSAPAPAAQATTAPGQAASVAPPPSPLKTALDAFLAASSKSGRSARETHERRERIAAFYAAHDYAQLWLDHGQWTSKAKAVLARLRQAKADGLNASALKIPNLEAGDEKTLLADELALTESVVLYAEQASGGRIDPHAISSYIASPHTQIPDAEILSKISTSSDPAATLDGFNPPQPGYKALRAELAKLRQHGGDDHGVRIPAGRILRVGMRDSRVPLIRERLGLGAPSPDQRLVYDKQIAEAVAEFQRSVGLAATGALTPLTAYRLSGGNDASLEDEIVANMELWRWTPRDMGTDRIEVNIPDFSLTLYHGDDAIRRAKVVVGKPKTPTPLFSDVIRDVIVNPSWIVPQSIIKKEMLPKLATDPTYFQDMGYVVRHRGNLLEVRQPPGDRNALGRIKFLFPNNYAVYLHDTPEKALFNDSMRAFSHGCVRVQDPFALGQDVLGESHGWSEARLKKLIGDRERAIRVTQPLPIHMEYFTAFMDSAGRLETRPDIYGYTRKIEADLRRLDGKPAPAPLVARTTRRLPAQHPLELE